MKKVIYMGNSIIYRNRGVHNHPQFKHLKYAPIGYQYEYANTYEEEIQNINICEAIGCGGGSRLSEVKEIIQKRRNAVNDEKAKLVNWCIENSISSEIYERYFRVVDLWDRQNQFPLEEKTLFFLPSYIFSLQKSPFVVEIEDIYTLFFPFIMNGEEKNMDVLGGDVFKFVKHLLERNECKAIIAHIDSTAESIKKNFGDKVAEKAIYIPVGVPMADQNVICHTYQKPLKDTIRLFFSSSWLGWNFDVRGGNDIIVAFDKLCDKYDNVELIIKCEVKMETLPEQVRAALARRSNKIKFITGILSDRDMDKVMKNMDIFLLPAARIHIVSILRTMAQGIPIITSDGWGIGEYIQDGINASVVKGRYGKSSWEDENGILMEDYDVMKVVNEEYAEDLKEKIELLINDEEYRYRITKQGMADISDKYSIDIYNSRLKKVYDDCYRNI